MKVKVYNLEGNQAGDLELVDEVFGVVVKPEVVHEVFVTQNSNQREPWADTKDRGEVRGGGKKPWAQKGTGRARHGSSRSPIWSGGGVTFGPLSIRNYKKSVNKKVKRLALKMCLSDRAQNDGLFVAEDLDFNESKTKLFVSFFKKLPLIGNKSILVVTDGKDEKVLRMTKNLKKVATVRAEDLNISDVLSKTNLLISKTAVEKLEVNLKKK